MKHTVNSRNGNSHGSRLPIHDPVMLVVERLEARGFDPRSTGPDSWESRCPGHNGSRSNLTVSRGDDGRALIHCHHEPSCSAQEIVEPIGLTLADLFPTDPMRRSRPNQTSGKASARSSSRSKPKHQAHGSPDAALAKMIEKHGAPTAHWVYHLQDGSEAMRVYRFDFLDPKTGKKEGKPLKPIRPVVRSAVVDDITVEAVSRHLAINPRGLLVPKDEGSAWVASINQYKQGKGSDRQFWLSALFGKSVRVDRKGNPDLEPVRIPRPFLSVVGNLPPEVLSVMNEQRGRSDGFFERILFAYPDPCPAPYWNKRGIPDELTAEWATIVNRLYGRLPALSDGKDHPHTVIMSPKAKARWIEWYNAYVDETNSADFDASELAALGKLRDFAARMVLILHLLHLATDPEHSVYDPIPEVPLAIVDAAIRLWRYFRSQHVRTRWFITGGIGNPTALQVVGWIRRNRKTNFTESELTDNLRWLNTRLDEPASSLRWLEERHVIRRRPHPDQSEGKRGRKPSQGYDVHPALLASGNSENS